MVARHNMDIQDIQHYAHFAMTQYREWLLNTENVERVYWAEYHIPHDIPDIDKSMEVVRPAKAKNILRKVLSMLAIRAEQSIRITQPGEGSRLAKRVERAERFLQGYAKALRRQLHSDVRRDAAWYTLMYGRGGIMTHYVPDQGEGLRVIQEALDPRTTLPFYSMAGLEWLVRDYYKPRHEMDEYFSRFDPKQTPFEIPDLYMSRHEDHVPAFADEVRVIEYWDDVYHRMLIDDFWVVEVEHGYGCIPYAERRINATPLYEQHRRSEGLLGAAVHSFETYYALMAKLATATETYFYPKLFLQTEHGGAQIVDSAGPNEWGELKAGTQPVVLNPTPNGQVHQMLESQLLEDIEQSTIPSVAFTQDVNGSGFHTSQILSQIKDALADYMYPLQDLFAHSYGDVMKMYHRFAEDQPDKGWVMPIFNESTGRATAQTYTQEDFTDMYDVDVKIEVPLPQDKLQKITMFNQLSTFGPDGRPLMPYRHRLKLSGLDEEIPDMEALLEQREFEFALTADQELAQKALQATRALNYERELEMDQAIESAAKKRETRDRREEEKAIERGLKQGLVIPAEKLNDPTVLQRMAQLVSQGQDPALALEEEPLQAMGLGQQPGGQPPSGGEGVEDILAALNGQPAANGLTGYEGMSSSALPPAAQGAQPRQVVDRPNVAVEAMEQQVRRGALPPPK